MHAAKPPTLICLTPVKNEAWILDRFLQCASTWADHIVIADQNSDDGSREIARRYPRVLLTENTSQKYDERGRQRLLLDTARSIPVEGKRILVALDADEMLSANWMSSPEWRRMLQAPLGTVVYFQWANVAPDLQRAWVPEKNIPFGFVDDGSPHEGMTIHSPRIPAPPSAPSLVMHDVKVLHYQYTNWTRMKSKQRWYQCWERLNDSAKRPVTLYRQYHRMDADVLKADPMPASWLGGYEERGIDMKTFSEEERYYWDGAIVEMIRQYGAETFRRCNIWDVDWTRTGKSLGLDVNGELADPRTPFEKAVHHWLARTQPNSHALHVRAMQKALRLRGW